MAYKTVRRNGRDVLINTKTGKEVGAGQRIANELAWMGKGITDNFTVMVSNVRVVVGVISFCFPAHKFSESVCVQMLGAVCIHDALTFVIVAVSECKTDVAFVKS